MEEQKEEYLDLIALCKRLFAHKKLFLGVWGITFVVACIIILPVPRTYYSEVKLVPENSSQLAGGSLASLASSFGINLGGMTSENAFFPDIYPDVISTNDFIVGLFDVPVESKDHEIKTDYFHYMMDFTKPAYYKYPKIWLARLISMFTTQETVPSKGGRLNPNHLDKKTDALVSDIRNSINCSVDKKTGVITIGVSAQDPVICATIADTIRVRLQDFIIDYQTQKARNDAEYYKKLMNEALLAYEKAAAEYDVFCESHANAQLQSIITRREYLLNEKNNRQNLYQGFLSQYQLMQAKIQERTPSFTILERPSVPVKAAKPKRVIFVLFMLVLSTIGVIAYLFKEEVVEQIKHMR